MLQLVIDTFGHMGLPVMLIILCCALLVLWHEQRQMDRRIQQASVHAQKALNELGQQRYALASLRQVILKPDIHVSEKQLLDQAITQLDDILKSLPTGNSKDDTVSTAALDADEQLKERDILSFIRKALREDQIALAVQPIKSMPYQHVHFYEVFSRIKVGRHYMAAGKFLGIAKSNGLISTVDQTFLLKTLQLIQKKAGKDYSIAYFCNVSADSFGNKKLMDSIVQYLTLQPLLASRLIFELTQDDTFRLNAHAKQVLERLLELGCRFSMDNVKMLGLDVERLRDLRLSFVKFNINTIIKETEDIAGKRRWIKLKNLLAGQGIEIIIEKIENDKQFDKIRDTHFDYAQGYHFGQPEIVH